MVVDTSAALQLLWKGSCTVTIREGTQDPVTKRIIFAEADIYTDQACKLSIETITTTAESNNAAQLIQKVKLFISPDVLIPAGSKITVIQNGKTSIYEKSGEPGVFSYHQEIMLELFKGWS
jgi:hypothetical protein